MTDRIRRRVIGHDQDYPGSVRWPIYEILCPECNQWSGDYGDVDVLHEGTYIPVCTACSDELNAEANPEGQLYVNPDDPRW